MGQPGDANPTTNAGSKRGRRLSLIDTDVHTQPRCWDDLKPYLPAGMRERGFPIPDTAGTGYANPIGVLRRDAFPPRGGPPGSCYRTLRKQLLDAYDIDYAILTGAEIVGIGTSADYYYAPVMAGAYNDWLVEAWLGEDPRLFGSLVIAPQNPAAAAREIRRMGGHPRIKQTIMTSASRIPYGNPFYHPIYEAAQECDLPVAIHPGHEGSGISGPPTSAGYPSSYFEKHTNISQSYMAQLVSLVSEGVFEKFPGLKFVCIEGGFGWVPHLMWRFDKNYKALRIQTPWLKRLPSETILEHVRFTSQPIEEPPRTSQLLELFEMMRADRVLMFASDYPHWDFDSPFAAFPKVPKELGERIFWRNAQELYGLETRVPEVEERRNG